MIMSPATSNCLRGLAILVIAAACIPSQAAGRKPLVLTYIANEGVLIASRDSKVLIDALFDKPNEEYRAPSREVLDAILKGEAPYDGVDLVLVTHNHPDHFDATLAASYLARFPGPVLLGPADAVAELRKAAEDWASIEPRVVSIDIEAGEQAKRKLKGIKLTAFRTPHSGDLESPINLVYSFELGGSRVLHEGDSTAKTGICRDPGLGGKPVDLALVHFWFPLDPDCARFLQEVLKPKHIGLMHLPIRLEGDAPGKIEQVKKYYEDIFLMLPGMTAKVLQ